MSTDPTTRCTPRPADREPSIHTQIHSPSAPAPTAALLRRYRQVRQFTEQICEPLTPEDCVIQSMPDASPTRWHLAHMTWFFETFVLKAAIPDYQPFDDAFEHLFNSYYNQVGEQFPRARRGLLSRPGVADVFRYRRVIDQRIEALLAGADSCLAAHLSTIEIGLHHEQQHQELMLTDVKHMLSCNPQFPAYKVRESLAQHGSTEPARWLPGAEGVRWIGHEGEGFAYDNEGPRHETLIQPHQLASRLVTSGEYLEFIEDGGYRRPELWLSLGWQTASDQSWLAPLYWYQVDGAWHQFTLSGLRPVDLSEPVCHVSYFEADAYARWRDARLPTEAEWEVAAADVPTAEDANFVERDTLHPAAAPANPAGELQQMFGDVWQWTSSPYVAYPGYRPPNGAIGEYNGKFMCNQYVLRGGSCATSQSHIRPTYRNFFPPEARWQFTGIRLAR